MALQHTDGYFVEGAGYDSSYNAVAMAVGYRLLLSGAESRGLKAALQRTTQWQAGRVAPRGEISTVENSRVFNGGETFMGKEKGMDAAHAVKAFALAGVAENNPALFQTAHAVAAHYGAQ